jgi:ABC-type multidrug transport system fused ATPase/permease subunit
MFALMVVSSLSEGVTIAVVMPLLGALTSPERIFELPAGQWVIQLLGITEPNELFLPIAVFFGGAVLASGALRLAVLWGRTRLAFGMGADLGIGVYRRTLFQPYSFHCKQNSSEIIDGISHKINAVIDAISQCSNLISACTTLIVVLFTIFVIEPTISLMAFTGFGIIYLLIIRLTRKKILGNSGRIADGSTRVVKALQEGLGGIRDVLIDGSQDEYCQIYREADLPWRRAQATNSFISASPRYILEALGLCLIVVLAYVLSQQRGGISAAIPILGVLALGSQRLLPVMQQAYAAWTEMRSAEIRVLRVVELLEQPLPDHAYASPPSPLPFNNHIRIKNLDFTYTDEMPCVLKNINLTIKKGERIGFIGSTGSGKSTLIDIVMGLLVPTSGQIEIDGAKVDGSNIRAWQLHIAHVPQTIFLSDSSIEENIAFGIPKGQIDKPRVRLAARQAQISSQIESMPEQYDTFVGERGVRLSGGQRQRIGIARALYKQADVIIFDEATSALDSDTEKVLMQAIEGLSTDLTLLLIAHRITTLKTCSQIVELSDGAVSRTGTYSEIVEESRGD